MSKLKERIIFDNRSSKPLYELYEMAFNFYFEYWTEEYTSQAFSCDGVLFYMSTNKDSITVRMTDMQ